MRHILYVLTKIGRQTKIKSKWLDELLDQLLKIDAIASINTKMQISPMHATSNSTGRLWPWYVHPMLARKRKIKSRKHFKNNTIVFRCFNILCLLISPAKHIPYKIDCNFKSCDYIINDTMTHVHERYGYMF